MARTPEASSRDGRAARGDPRRRVLLGGVTRRRVSLGTDPGKSGEADAVVVRETRTKQRLQRPRLWRVLLHNDHYTTMEFVVAILMAIFHRNEADATAIMLHVHQRGMGVAGVYTKEIAQAKVDEVMRAAERAEYPLLCTCEPDQDPEETDE